MSPREGKKQNLKQDTEVGSRREGPSPTDDGDAARLGDLHHLVHHVLGAVGEGVPLEHAHGAVPHDLLGAAHSLSEELGGLRPAVQTLGCQRATVRKVFSGH